jgi:DNA-binding response OmpR family regulator
LRALADSTVLVVEDEGLIGFDVVDALRDAGCRQVHLAASVAGATALIHQHSPHVAVLDVRLGHETSFPLADMLGLMRTPFVFLTAERPETFPQQHRDRPLVAKPYSAADLVAAVVKALNPGAPAEAAPPLAASPPDHADSAPPKPHDPDSSE